MFWKRWYFLIRICPYISGLKLIYNMSTNYLCEWFPTINVLCINITTNLNFTYCCLRSRAKTYMHMPWPFWYNNPHSACNPNHNWQPISNHSALVLLPPERLVYWHESSAIEPTLAHYRFAYRLLKERVKLKGQNITFKCCTFCGSTHNS